MDLNKGIALDKDVIDEVVKRTGLDKTLVKKNIEYINRRIYELMSDKNNDVIYLTGLGYIFRQPHKNNKDLRSRITEKRDLLKVQHGGERKIPIPNYVRTLFSKLKLKGFSEQEIEHNQNNEVVMKGILYSYKKEKK